MVAGSLPTGGAAGLDKLDIGQTLTMAIDLEQLLQWLGRSDQPSYAVVPYGAKP